MRHKSKWYTPFIFVFTLFMALPVISETASTETTLRYRGGNTYYLVERSNWSKYIDGKYIGLTHRENRASLTVSGSAAEGIRFSGVFYVLEETLRDMTHSSRGIDAIVETSFIISQSGEMVFKVDNGYPELRSFPVYPDTPVKSGDKWQAAGFRIIDPKNDGKKTKLPIQVEYQFIGEEIYKDQSVYRIKARYATRLNKYLMNKNDDSELQNATGTHDLDILVSADSGAAVLILDRLDETFFYTNGGSVRFKGSTALFTEAPVPVQHEKLIPEIDSIVAKAETHKTDSGATADDYFGERAPPVSPPVSPPLPVVPPVPGKTKDAPFTVEQTPQGIRLSIRDIRFLPDSDIILDNEKWRLDSIAETLRLVKGGRFLVEGHTASVGKTAGEKELSVKRAQKIVDELTKRGLLSEQFMFTGWGGTHPVADNSTSEGRAQNRRVEITILE